MEKKHGRKKGSVIWAILAIIALLGCIVCICIIVRYVYKDYKTRKAYEELSESWQEVTEEVTEEVTAQESSMPAQPPEQEKEPLAANPINFEELWEINPEIYAWLRIPDTNVDYPIAQHEGEDQTYYLYYTVYGEKETAASIYTENLNSRDFSDPNTLIYGHNMKNGSMFHDLRYYADQDYFDEHSQIYIYLPERILTYEVVASYEYDDRHLLYAFDFEDDKVFAEYLYNIMHPRSMYARVNENVELTTDDRIITLSTCVGGKSDARRLVQAVLVDDVEAEYIGEVQAESAETE